MKKTAAEQSTQSKILSASAGAVPAALAGASIADRVAEKFGLKGTGRNLATLAGASVAGTAGGLATHDISKSGGPITRRILNSLGGGILGAAGSGVAAGFATEPMTDKAMQPSRDAWHAELDESFGPKGDLTIDPKIDADFEAAMDKNYGIQGGVMAGASATGGLAGLIGGALAPTDKAPEEEATEKIAEILGALHPHELRALVDMPYGPREAKMAMTVGFCNKLAEYGLTPSDMNAMMTKTADPITQTVAAGAAAGKMIGVGTLAAVITAALAGNITGKMHHSGERRFNKMDDKENVRLREKANRLASQRDELSEDLSSRPALKAPAAPVSKKRDIVQLLD